MKEGNGDALSSRSSIVQTARWSQILWPFLSHDKSFGSRWMLVQFLKASSISASKLFLKFHIFVHFAYLSLLALTQQSVQMCAKSLASHTSSLFAQIFLPLGLTIWHLMWVIGSLKTSWFSFYQHAASYSLHWKANRTGSWCIAIMAYLDLQPSSALTVSHLCSILKTSFSLTCSCTSHENP